MPAIGSIALHEPVSTASAPSIMYGPEATTSAPYAPGFPSKQRATSRGIGAAAGIARRRGKSTVGLVTVNVIVLALGVAMPEIDRDVPARYASKPSITANASAN